MIEDKKILITGGAGFIGSNLLKVLLNKGASIKIIDNLERGRLEYIKDFINDVEFLHEDVRDISKIKSACKGIDVVFHLASKVGGIKYYLDNPANVFSDMILIDQNVWKSSVENNVPYFFYASSAHVYPIDLQLAPDAPLIREEQAYPANPELSYGWAKLMGEKQIEYSIKEGCGTRASIARIIGAYGPNQDIDLNTGSAIPVFIRRAIEYPNLKPFRVLGTGEETRSYCYVDDIIEGIIRSIEKLETEQFVKPFNLGSEDRIKIGDLAKEVIKTSGKDINIEWDKSHPTTIWGQALDCSLSRELFNGWVPKVPLNEGLRICYDHIYSRLTKQN